MAKKKGKKISVYLYKAVSYFNLNVNANLNYRINVK